MTRVLSPSVPAAHSGVAWACALLCAGLCITGCQAPARGGGDGDQTGCASDAACPSHHSCTGGICVALRGDGSRLGIDGYSVDLRDGRGALDDGARRAADSLAAARSDSAQPDQAAGSGDSERGAETGPSDSGASDTAASAPHSDTQTGYDSAGVDALDAAKDTETNAKSCQSATDCDDLDPCTHDSCAAGVCAHSVIVGCCTKDAQCDDSQVCTSDSCIGGTCSFELEKTHCFINGTCIAPKTPGPKPCQVCAPLLQHKDWSIVDGAPCDDGSACTDGDTCDLQGACKGKPNGCDDGNKCTTDSCAAGKCLHTSVAGCGVKLADLKPLSLSTVAGSYKPGATVPTFAVIQNIGLASAGPFEAAFRLSKDKLIDTNDLLLASATLQGCGVGKTTATAPPLQLPASLAAGSWHIGLQVDAKAAVPESDETNNTATTAITVVKAPVKGPDLAVASLVLSKSSYKVTDVVEATLTSHNLGSADASTFKVEFRFSADKVVEISDTLLYTAFVPALKAGAKHKMTRNLKLPATTSAGPWHVAAILDAGGAIAEADESNNTATAALSVKP